MTPAEARYIEARDAPRGSCLARESRVRYEVWREAEGRPVLRPGTLLDVERTRRLQALLRQGMAVGVALRWMG